MLKLADVAAAVAQHVRIRALARRPGAVKLILEVQTAIATTLATRLAYRHEFAIMIEYSGGGTVEAGVSRYHARRAGHGGSRGASGSVMSAPTAPGRHTPTPLLEHHGTAEVLVAGVVRAAQLMVMVAAETEVLGRVVAASRTPLLTTPQRTATTARITT